MPGLPRPVVNGTGIAGLGGEVPAVQLGDMQRDPAADYRFADDTERAWIRRAAHAEAFARALEAELEVARAKLREVNHASKVEIVASPDPQDVAGCKRGRPE